MCVRGSACPDSANLMAYPRVSMRDFWHDGAPTQAEIADHGEDASSMKPAATSSGNRPAAPGSTSPRDRGSLRRCQRAEWYLNRRCTSDCAERDIRPLQRQVDRAYAGDAPGPARQFADMPDVTGSPTGRQELSGECEQH